jgi:hypothetical protein
MTKKLDGQLGVKLDHDISIQKLRIDSKKLELDLLREKLREKLENKKPAPSNGPKKATSLTLSEKKDFETHKAEVKRQAKDNDATREKLKTTTRPPMFGRISVLPQTYCKTGSMAVFGRREPSRT